MSRRPSRRCPRASGIGHRSRRQADSGGSWPQCIVETWRGCLRNSAKSPPPLRTCRRAFSATADSGKEKRYAMTCPWQHKHNPFHRKVRDKQFFYIFDYCENLEFFSANPQGIGDAPLQESVKQKVFRRRLQLATALQHLSDRDEA